MSEIERKEKWSPEYAAYHAKVVDACVGVFGEDSRYFFDHECDYFEEFNDGIIPEECAEAQYDALT